MNSEERDLISRFVARVGGGQTEGQLAPRNLPPIDPEADRFIEENFRKYPEARYRITQLAVVQESALVQAQNRIRDLEFQLRQAQAQIAQLQNGQARSGQSGGFLSGLFGGGAGRSGSASAPPGWNTGAASPQVPGMAPNAAAPGVYAPPPVSAYPRSGSGFLGSALTTAAGVAGGMMAANALESLFSGHHGGESSGFASGGETIINNNYGDVAGSAPFAGSGTEAGGFSQSDFPDEDFSAHQEKNNWGDTNNDGWGSTDESTSGGFDDDSFGDDSFF